MKAGMMPTWEVMIPSLCSRTDRLTTLLENLTAQADRHDHRVRVTVYRNQGERPLAEVRQALLEYAEARYVCFVDDDDVLPEYYVATVLPLMDGADYIGWRMQVYINGERMKPTFHSLEFGTWYETDEAYYRTVTHLNPIRLPIARMESYVGELPEDYDWSRRVQRWVMTQHLVPNDKIMYHYYHTTGDSWWVPGTVTRGGTYPPRPDIRSPNLRYHPESTC